MGKYICITKVRAEKINRMTAPKLDWVKIKSEVEKWKWELFYSDPNAWSTDKFWEKLEEVVERELNRE